MELNSIESSNFKWTQLILYFTIYLEPITFLDEQVIQSVKENEDALIKCMVLGDPEPSVSWYYNGQPLIGTTFYS